MSDSQRIRGLGGIKPSRMPSSAAPEITVSEAEKRLGIGRNEESSQESLREGSPTGTQESLTKGTLASHTDSHTTGKVDSNTTGMSSSMLESLPNSLRNKRTKLITVSRTFRLPLPLMEDLEKVAAMHDIPMVTILAEALEIHLARFPH